MFLFRGGDALLRSSYYGYKAWTIPRLMRNRQGKVLVALVMGAVPFPVTLGTRLTKVEDILGLFQDGVCLGKRLSW